MPGSLRQTPSGAWSLRVYLGRDDNGRVVHKNRTFHGSKKQAREELNRMVVEFEGGLEAVHAAESAEEERPMRWGPTTTINDAIEGWKLNGWDDLSPTTRRTYESMWKNYVRESIGKRRLVDLTPWDVERFLRRIKDEKTLSEATVRQTRALLHRACRLARKWSNGALPNPVADTELPEWSYEEQRTVVRSPTADEVRAVLAAAEKIDRRLAVFIRVTAATGGRRGEVCALRWSDIDWDGSTLRFDEAIVQVGGPATVKAPKTRRSVRRVAVDMGTLDELRRYRAELRETARLCELQLEDDAFIFSVHSTPPPRAHPDPFSSGFRKAADKAEVAKDVHLHSLRHFQSTELDAVISEAQKHARMGWTTVQMARRYTDAVGEEDRRAAKHIGDVLG